MKKAILFLLVLILLPAGSAFAEHQEADNGCFIYEGVYKFKIFYPGERPERVSSYGEVDLHRLDDPADIYLYFTLDVGADKFAVGGDEYEICGISHYTQSGKKSKFWALSTFLDGENPSPEHPEDGQITALGELRTSNHDKRLRLKGSGAMLIYETLVYFEFRFGGKYIKP